VRGQPSGKINKNMHRNYFVIVMRHQNKLPSVIYVFPALWFMRLLKYTRSSHSIIYQFMWLWLLFCSGMQQIPSRFLG